jgi:hypothetical protein
MSVPLTGSLGLLFLVWSLSHCIALSDFSSRWWRSVILRGLLSIVVGLLCAFTLQLWGWTLLWLVATILLDALLLTIEDLRYAGSFYLGNALLLTALLYFSPYGGFSAPEHIYVLDKPEVIRGIWSLGLLLLGTQPGNHLVRSVLRSCDSPLPGQASKSRGLFSSFRSLGVMESAATELAEQPDETTAPLAQQAIGRGRLPAESESLLSSAQENPRLGKVIGTLERLLIITLVATDSYAALGFIIGAKGFVRYRKLADERFAEYFLIGTMTSTLIGVLIGLGMRVLW